MSDKISVGLIYGGKSGEHEVSLQTAFAVIREFDFNKYEVQPFYITKEGQWRAGAALHEAVSSVSSLTLDDALLQGAEAIAAIFASGKAAGGGKKPLDVVVPLLHGTYGEDGTIQGMLEIADVAYAGAGVLASAVGMDKVLMKKVFAQEGLPQCVFRHFTRSQWEKDDAFFLMEIEIAIGYPCFVKPVNLGSSVGVSKARNRDELIEAIRTALLYDRKVIVEEFIDARELEVAVLGNDEPQASVVGEIVSSNEFYDYKAKYIDGKSAMNIPADVPADISEQIRELALRAFQAIDGSGLSRVDFFLRKEDNQVLINEINTMPGFTPFSMYPLLWRESGKPYRELLDDLISLALERHAAKQRLQYSFDL